jgi:hypothetical protein
VSLELVSCRLQGRQKRLAAFKKQPSGIRQADRAGRSIEQTNAKARFQLGNVLAHSRRRHFERRGRAREAVSCCHRLKSL